MPDFPPVDLNADLGEGFGAWRLGDDEALLDVVTSANVACGFHAGDPVIMRRTCEQAAQRGVTIGAQVGYRDLAGFGRRRMDVAADELAADVLYQLGALAAFAEAAGTGVAYVKPHGALYNTAVDDLVQAGAVAAAVATFDTALPLLALPGSALEHAAIRHGLPFVPEAFADRAYTPDGRLAPRHEPAALITDPAEAAAQALRIVHGHVTALGGDRVPVRARSICVHGDTPDAVRIARAVRAALDEAGIAVEPFTR
jgi:UPF0271 protein